MDIIRLHQIGLTDGNSVNPERLLLLILAESTKCLGKIWPCFEAKGRSTLQAAALLFELA